MKQEVPYRYLSLINDPLVEDWKGVIEDINSSFIYLDSQGSLLKQELKNLFFDCGLIPKRGNLWSREPHNLPPYHTDQKVNCELFAINWLLIGEPGLTEWSYKALEYKDDNWTPLYKTTSPQFWGNMYMEPDFTAVLNKPMMIKTDIPHRVNNRDNNTWRISYSLRFENNPTWEVGLEKLSKFLVD